MKLSKIAHCFGNGPEMFFAVDTKSKPGKIIFHFVRFKTVVVDDDGHFDQTVLKSLHHDNDPRIEILQSCLKGSRYE